MQPPGQGGNGGGEPRLIFLRDDPRQTVVAGIGKPGIGFGASRIQLGEVRFGRDLYRSDRRGRNARPLRKLRQTWGRPCLAP